jgi:hypothetical protein
MMRSVAHRLLFTATLLIGLVAGLGLISAAPLIDAGPAEDVDLSPFEARLRGIAKEYGLEFKVDGQAFSGGYGDAFLVRLGENTDCRHTAKCVYILFRNAADQSPLVTICKPVNYDMAHGHRFNGMLEYRFYFSCETDSKFIISISPNTVFVISGHPKE